MTSVANAPLLEARGLSISFGGLTAVEDFSLTLPAGKLYGLIGPNGAGKTTVFNLLTGVYQPDAGQLTLGGKRLTGMAPHEVAAAGIARTFQNIRLFRELSALDNVRLAGQLRTRTSLVDTVVRTCRHHAEEEALRRHSLELLDLFELSDRALAPSASLSYGHQRHLEIVRALATRPQVLLLDEPAAGLNSQEKRELTTSIRNLCNRFGVAILLIDHDMRLVMDLCERITVLDHGATIAEGPPAAIQNDPEVIAAYLGTDAAAAPHST
jgi:branched-chain amino acid transport system ATP-binding protein